MTGGQGRDILRARGRPLPTLPDAEALAGTGRASQGHRIEDDVAYCQEVLVVYGDDDEQVRLPSWSQVLEDPGDPEVEVSPDGVVR